MFTILGTAICGRLRRGVVFLCSEKVGAEGVGEFVVGAFVPWFADDGRTARDYVPV